MINPEVKPCAPSAVIGGAQGSARPQTKRPPRGWSLRLQTCLSRFGQATEAKPLASGGLQGAANHTTWGAWGHQLC